MDLTTLTLLRLISAHLRLTEGRASRKLMTADVHHMELLNLREK